ncbi:hypothetical protein FJ546_28485 [Mesorhizobium sp. B2-4-19]|uniref:beta strand repeat-containing protein n=1 Tax=Mesorhizobium sp. B2-4-19 TaxID=2589930 RepID=UPI001126A318|nr:hypothetical protein [Mesorhizobium sp. B2-4-19]TPK55940.1 hypothetical protein FJ546_28485 [Mesorhizobium sp. B2-4-19]
MAIDLGSGVLLEATTEGSGTGNYGSFLRLQATNIEQGFNTDQNGNVLDNKASFTHDLQYGNMQSITVDGIQYIEFRLDLNESNNAANGDITLTGLDIYISNAGATLANYTAGFTTGFTGIFHLGPDQLLVDSNHGSGTDDYRVLVPVSDFTAAGVSAGSYVTLFSSFSGSNGGFEEWRTLTTPGTGTSTPGIGIDKITIDGAAAGDGLTVLTGDAISWQYTVSNTGNVALSNVAVTDNQGVVVAPVLSGGFNVGDVNHNNLLDTTETWSFTGSGTAITGGYANIGHVSALAGAVSVSDDDGSSYFGANPQIVIDKVTVDGAAKGDALTILTGEPISWEYTVTNGGNVALSDVTVSDSDGGVTPVAVTGNGHVTNIGDINDNNKLDVGEVWKFSASGTSVTGAYSNTGTASGSFTDDALHTRTDTATDDSGYTGANPQIVIDKVTVDGAAKGDALTILTGEPISWEYTVTNGGNVALSDVTVSDSDGSVTPVAVTGNGHVTNIGDINDNNKLDVGEIWKFSASGTSITGPYSNTGTASGSFTDDALHTRTDTATDDSGYSGANPHITLDKKTNGVDHDLNIFQGQPVTWTYDVTNDGNVALANPAVTDDKGVTITAILGGDLSHNIGDTNVDGVFDIGETWHYKATGIAQLGDYVNTATATTDAFVDTAGHPRTPLATDSSNYEGFSNKALTQGFWGSHSDAWDGVAGHESNPTKSAFGSGVIWGLDINPRHDGNLLLGDSNGNGTVDVGEHTLLISNSLAKAIESSSTGGDARIIMLQQAIATQLNIDNHVTQPNDLISEAVMWLKGEGAWAGLVNLDTNHDGKIDTNLAGTALAGSAVKTSSDAWTKYVDVTDPSSGITDWNGGKEADGEGLKNALMWFNQGQLVTSGPGGHVAWFDGTNVVDEHPNTLDQFWLTLHDVGGLTGVA